MNTLAPGVTRIITGKGDRENAFLVEGEHGLNLVDVGWGRAPAAIRRSVEESGHRLSDITTIVVTHAHPDHVRGLAEMVALTSARVLIHEGDAPWLRTGRVPPSGRSGVLAHVADMLPLLHWTPVEPDCHVTDGEVVDGLRVIHTPGHSPGHIALLHEPSNTLLVGDALFHRTPEVATGPDAFAADPTERDQTLGRLPQDVAAVGFAHGAPLIGGEVDALAAFIARHAH